MALTLVPFATLKAVLGLEGTALSAYPALAAMQTSVYAAFESHLGRWLELDDYTETVYVDGRIVSLKALPVASLASIVDADGNDLSADCVIRRDSIKLGLELIGEVTVSYAGGLEEIGTAENWLTRAALMQITHEHQRKDQMGSTSVNNDGGSVQYAGEVVLLKEVKRLLDPNVNPARWA